MPSFFLAPHPAPSTFSCTVLHVDDDPLGIRVVESPASRLVVIAAPWHRLGEALAGTGDLTAAAYILAGAIYPEGPFARVYIGETVDLRERMARHAASPDKSFVTTAYLISSRDPAFAKREVTGLQYLLDRRAEEVDRAAIVRGARPSRRDLNDAELDRLGLLLEDARRLLAAVGCVVLEPVGRPQFPSLAQHLGLAQSPGTNSPRSARSEEASELSAPLAPALEPGGAMLAGQPLPRAVHLSHRGLWAHALAIDGVVILRGGSEVRRETIPSLDEGIARKRLALQAAGLLAPVPARPEMWRLLCDVVVPSLTNAARFVTGQHVGPDAWSDAHPVPPG